MSGLKALMAEIAGLSVGATDVVQTGERQEMNSVYSDILGILHYTAGVRIMHCNSVMIQARDSEYRMTVICQPLARWDGEYRVKTVLSALK